MRKQTFTSRVTRLSLFWVMMLCTMVAWAQQSITVSGRVLDDQREPLPGASIVVVGTDRGTTTDLDGSFRLERVASGAMLEVSFVGMSPQRVKASSSPLTIILASDNALLDEVVVVGYGVVRKADLAGAVSVLGNKAFKDQPITHVTDALQGRVAGVQVENSGIPGGSIKVRVRGANSVNKSNEPLYVVDGIVRESGLDGISSEDIKSMQVLKDASSTAIYGARGSNGVVLVTTKTGAAGSREIVFDASLGVANSSGRYDLLSPSEYAKALTDIKGVAFTPEQLEGYKSGKLGTDWQDEIFRSGLTQNYKLAISSGSDKMQYYISGNYMNQDGIVLNTSNRRYQGKLNLTSQLTDRLHVTADLNVASNRRQGASFTGGDNPIFAALNYSPTGAVVDSDGNYVRDTYSSIAANPVGQLKYGSEVISNTLTGRVDLRYQFLKGLTFTTTNGFDFVGNKSYDMSSVRVGNQSSMSNGYGERLTLQTTNNLTYMAKWDKHNLTATGVFEATQSEYRGLGIAGRNLLNENLGWWNIGLATTRDASNAYSKWALLSGVMRAIYNYDDRYMVTATFRADGSSRFSQEKWGYFPSLAVAWTLSNEAFMRGIKQINDLKLRASYGTVGNQAVDPYGTIGALSQTGIDFGTGSNFSGYRFTTIATPFLTWEKTRQTDFGLDATLFDRRIELSLDLYSKYTVDALVKTTSAGYLGSSEYWVNTGEVRNNGLDASLTAHLFRDKVFGWSSTLNVTYNKNEVVKLSGKQNEFLFGDKPAGGMSQPVTIIKPGYPISSFYGYEWIGLDKNGVNTYKDMNNDGKIDANNDRAVIGKATPDATFGWNNSLYYKEWELNFFFNASVGASRFNLVRFAMSNPTGPSRFVTLRDAYFQSYDVAGSGAAYPTLKGDSKLKPESSQWIERADYLRLENVSLSYNLKKAVTKFADIRLSLSAQNLFTLTSYKGLDPAGSSVPYGNADQNAGIDLGAYPLPRTVTFGVRMTF